MTIQTCPCGKPGHMPGGYCDDCYFKLPPNKRGKAR